MRRQLFVRPVDPWLVTVHQIHAALQVVRNPDLRTATEVIRHPLMGLRPRFQRLVQCRFDVGVTARAQRPDEQLHFDELSRFWIDDVRLLPRKIDECLLACSMPLTHRRVQLLLPLTVQLAITAVAVRSRLILRVLHPQLQQRQLSVTPQLLVDVGIVQTRPCARRARRRKQPCLQLPVAQLLRERPAQTTLLRLGQVLTHRSNRHAKCLCDRAVSKTQLVL